MLGSVALAFPLSDFPYNRANLLLTVPLLVAMAGTFDTVRCMRKQWSFYHGGVLLCVYMDLMALMLILVFLVYPYSRWMAPGR